MTGIPPVLVRIDLRKRCNFNTMSWIFNTYATVEYQLDSALMLFNRGEMDHAFEDAVGSEYFDAVHIYISNWESKSSSR